MSAEARFAALNLELPPAPKAVGLYRPAVEAGGFLYLSGHGPLRPDGTLILGRNTFFDGRIFDLSAPA